MHGHLNVKFTVLHLDKVVEAFRVCFKEAVQAETQGHRSWNELLTFASKTAVKSSVDIAYKTKHKFCSMTDRYSACGFHKQLCLHRVPSIRTSAAIPLVAHM